MAVFRAIVSLGLSAALSSASGTESCADGTCANLNLLQAAFEVRAVTEAPAESAEAPGPGVHETIKKTDCTSATCTPKCQWTCATKTCDQTCKPKCQAPRCQTRCIGKVTDGCKMECGKPSCATVCPKEHHCAKGGCPECETKCSKSMCTMKCPQAQKCHEVCEHPICDWECTKPTDKDCPKPECTMECETPKDCMKATYKDLPPVKEEETVVRSYEGGTASEKTSTTDDTKADKKKDEKAGKKGDKAADTKDAKPADKAAAKDGKAAVAEEKTAASLMDRVASVQIESGPNLVPSLISLPVVQLAC